MDENNNVCRHHSGHLARLNELQREVDSLVDIQKGFGEEMGSLKKWLLGFLMALLVGVYGNLAASWIMSKGQTASEQKQHTKELATEILRQLGER